MEAGVTEKLCFFTDRSYCCGKYQEFENVRLYNIIGPDLAERGHIIHIVSDIFSESQQELYYSPFERMLPCALFLPETGTLTACGYNSYSSERLSGRYFDAGRIIENRAAPVEEIVGYTMSQSRAYMRKSIELTGIANLLLKEYIRNGAELLQTDKLRSYAGRKLTSMLGGVRNGQGRETCRSISAITCGGYRFAPLPENFRIIRLCDDFMAASRIFVRAASRTANKLGYDTIISRAVDSEHAPLHLVIPETETIFVSESAILKTRFESSPKIALGRFYSRSLLSSREHYISFFSEYIRKMYSDAALYARICMDIKNQGRKLLMPFVSEKAASEIASEIIYGILNTQQ